MTQSKSKRPGRVPQRPVSGPPPRVGARSFNRQAKQPHKPLPRNRVISERPRSRRSPRALLSGIPNAALICALVACINAACWSVITPPLQVPDEPEHVAYVKSFAERSKIPSHSGNFSSEELVALQDTKLQEVAEQPELPAIRTRAENEKLEGDLAHASTLPRNGSEYGGVAASQPPLYYALQSIPYTLGASGSLLDRIEMMRLLSALFGGLTALFTFLFLREVVPRHSWAWTVGGLSVAVFPTLGFMSGAVNPDSMLFAVTASLFYLLARSFRRGLKRADAVTIGIVAAIGMMTKLNFLGVEPGVLLGLIVLSIRAARTLGRAAYVSLAIGMALALSPAVVFVLAHLASGSPPFGIVSSGLDSLKGGSLWSEISYIWQLYLPRLPGMSTDFGGVSSTIQIWFKGLVGLYGWLDTQFPGWVYDFALIPAVLILLLCARTLIASAGAVRARALEIAVYLVMAIGLMVLIGADSYLAFPGTNAEYGQFRYLLPLIPLLGLVLALASRGAGRRWGPVVGVVIIMLFLGQDIFSQLQEIARYYG